MNSRDTIKFSVIFDEKDKKGKEFELYAEETFFEQRQIESIMAELYGGIIPYERARLELNTILASLPSDQEDSIKYIPEMTICLYTDQVMKKCRMYAILKVLKKKLPDGFENVEDIKPEPLEKILAAHEVAVTDYFQMRQKKFAA